MRIACAAGIALLLLGGAAATGGTAMRTVASVLGRPVAPGVAATVADAPDDGAALEVPAETNVLAVSGGEVVVDAAGLRVTGTGDDAGLDVGYSGVRVSMPPPPLVQRGETLGIASSSPANVVIHATLDGRPLDTAALLRATLQGSLDGAADWVRPVDAATVTQAFGCTPYAMEPVDRSCASGHFHSGIDLAAPLGTPVHATIGGDVRVIVSATGYGLHVIVNDGDGLETLYGHLESVAVHDGDCVDPGDLIGMVGSTGNSTGPHLHFEVRRDGIPEDPTLDVALP